MQSDNWGSKIHFQEAFVLFLVIQDHVKTIFERQI